MKSSKLFLIGAALLSLSFGACSGGGSSSDSGLVIEGTLTEAGGAGHAALSARHGTGQRIGSVEVCALGECSTTDDEGQWGFLASDDFAGGDILFTVVGHGINTTSTVDIPRGAKDVFLDFQHVEGGKIEAAHITIDGVTSHHEGEGHE